MEISMVTLGVSDLDESTAFYERLGLARSGHSTDGVTFFALDGAWLGLFPLEELAKDAGISPGRGSTAAIAYNLESEEAVDSFFKTVRAAGGRVVKEPQKVFWGGYSGYFADPDGHLWEIAYNPHFRPGRNI